MADAETSLGQAANHSTIPHAMQHQPSEAPDGHRFAPLPEDGVRARCDDLDDPDADPFANLDDQFEYEGELCTAESNIGCRPDAIGSSPTPSREVYLGGPEAAILGVSGNSSSSRPLLDAARPRDCVAESGTQQRGRQTHAGDNVPTHEEPAVLQHRTSDKH
eukprot:641671-Pyramimonas_sp.AAC.1